MGLKDNVTKEYMKDNRRFADMFNSFMYEGEQVIKPESLQMQDTTEILNFYGINDDIISKQEFRDILKKCVLMHDERAYYLLLGIENQSNIHYAMPVKNYIYDALNYGAQASEAAKIHRELKDTKGAEFLSGFSKTDKLTPVITLVVALLIKKSDFYSDVDVDSAKVLESCMGISFPDKTTKGGVNVCKAINDIIENQTKENAISFYKNGVSIEIIAKSLSLPIEKIRSWILAAGLQIL